ncbi:Thioredoxin domain-containing protein 8 [Plecturocebus cupreus]
MHISSFIFWFQNEFKTFLTAAGHKLTVVEFSSTWCGPCKRMFPIFHAMSVKYQNVFFANVDVNNSPELAETCHIRRIPTFQMFKKSQKGSISMPTPTSELHSYQKWTLDYSQANPSQTRANFRTLLKQLGKQPSLLVSLNLNLGIYESETTTAFHHTKPENESTIQKKT